MAVGPPPALASEFVTFGCFNNRSKITAGTIELWANVLKYTAGSRLLLKTRSLTDAAVRQDLLDRFAAYGIGGDRLSMEGHSPRAELLSAYNRVDIALDPFPFGGGTTTAEALWMGVPVVTLRGDRWVGRVSESILSTIGLPELVAGSQADYVDIAAKLAVDRFRLKSLRMGLRTKVVTSPLCDGTKFTRNLETGYRRMHETRCARQSMKESKAS